MISVMCPYRAIDVDSAALDLEIQSIVSQIYGKPWSHWRSLDILRIIMSVRCWTCQTWPRSHDLCCLIRIHEMPRQNWIQNCVHIYTRTVSARALDGLDPRTISAAVFVAVFKGPFEPFPGFESLPISLTLAEMRKDEIQQNNK